MLHSKFPENQPTGSGEEDFLVFFTIYRRGGHPGHGTKILRTKYKCHFPSRLYIRFQLERRNGFREDLSNCGRRTDRRTDAGSWPSYKLTL